MGLDDHVEFQVAEILWKWLSPVMIISGTLGNVLTIAVLTRAKTRHSSTARYLTALACADLLVLYTGLLQEWVRHMFGVDIRQLSVPVCKINLCTAYIGAHSSSWLLIAVTAERFIGVWFPHKVKLGCTPRTAGIVITAIITCIACLNSHWLVGQGEGEEGEGNTTYTSLCTHITYDSYQYFMMHIWPSIDMCVFALVPFVVLFTANVAIIYKVVYSTRIASTSGGNTKNSQLTAMLITINIVFCICVFPSSVFFIYQDALINNIETSQGYARFLLWWAVANIFAYANNTVNFLLYFLSGTRFRQEVKAMFCGGRTQSLFAEVGRTTDAVPRGRNSTSGGIATINSVKD